MDKERKSMSLRQLFEMTPEQMLQWELAIRAKTYSAQFS